jgi:hypothetical protein
MQMDEVLASVADKVKNFAVIYLVDKGAVPDFNAMYELYDPCTVMFFFRNKVRWWWWWWWWGVWVGGGVGGGGGGGVIVSGYRAQILGWVGWFGVWFRMRIARRARPAPNTLSTTAKDNYRPAPSLCAAAAVPLRQRPRRARAARLGTPTAGRAPRAPADTSTSLSSTILLLRPFLTP